MKFFCAVMLIGILVSCSHGRAFPTDMLAKVNFNKIADEMDIYEKRREERRETRQDKTRECGPCGVCCVACMHKYMIFTFFLHVVVVVPLTFHNVSSFFLLLAAVSSTVSHVDVTQHVRQCLKLQREAKKR